MRLFSSLLILGFLWVAPGWAQDRLVDTDQLEQAKAHLLERLSRKVVEQENEQAAFHAEIQQQGGMPTDQNGHPRFTVPVETVIAGAERQLASTRHFLQLIQQRPASALPTFLSGLFLSCQNGTCTEDVTSDTVDDSIADFGIPALRLVLAELPKLDTWRKETALLLTLKVEPLTCPTPVLQTALDDTVFRVRAAALRVFRKNCTEAAFVQALNQLLASEQNHNFLMALLDEVPSESTQAAPFRNRLFQLAQQKRIPVELAFSRVCDASKSAIVLETEAILVPFWLKTFATYPLQRSCILEHIFLKLRNDKQLSQLRPLFHSAAEGQYGFSATQGLYGQTASADAANWGGVPSLAEALLQVMQKYLRRETLKTWLAAPETSLGEQLLLQRWLGIAKPELPTQWQINLEVTAPDKTRVAAGAQAVKLGIPFAFTVPPLSSAFQTIAYSGTLIFDAEKLRLKVPDLIVGLQPAGAGFAATIPLTGRFSTTLTIAGQPYVWTLWAVPN